MNLKRQEQFQEDLLFLRERFDELNEEIKLPASLSAEALMAKLETIDVQDKPLRPRFRQKTWMGMAACFVLICGSMFGFLQINTKEGQLKGMPEATAVPQAVAFSLEQDASVNATEAVEDPSFRARDLQEDAVTEEEMRLVVAEDESHVLSPGEMLGNLETAKAKVPYGAYLPEEGAVGLHFMEGYLSEQCLSARYISSDQSKELLIEVSQATEETYAHLADIEDAKTYDLREYTVPYAQSIPENLQWVVNDVVVPKEQLTLSVLEGRIISHQDAGDAAKQSGQIAVLLPEGMVVQYRTTNISPEELISLIKAD